MNDFPAEFANKKHSVVVSLHSCVHLLTENTIVVVMLNLEESLRGSVEGK